MGEQVNMKTPLEIIADFGADTNSYIAAVQYLSAKTLTKEQYEQGIADIVGAEHCPTFSNEKEARLYFLYVVQETVRAFGTGDVPEMSDIYVESVRRARKFISNNPYVIKDYQPRNAPLNVNPHKTSHKKGDKKRQALSIYKSMNNGVNTRDDIIKTLMEKVDMTKAGATTYFHAMRKEHGFSGPASPRKPKATKEPKVITVKAPKGKKKINGMTKGAIARQVYTEMSGKPKADVIAEIVKRAQTTKAGANTYFCACKKSG